MNNFNLIIGAGAVGQALHCYFKDCLLIDKNYSTTISNIFYMHIAFPYDSNFVREVKNYIKKYSPKIVIIHSTVKVGATREIQNIVNCAIIYSPILGQHDELERSLKVFDKWIACLPEKKEFAKQVCDYFKENGLNPSSVISDIPEELELAKLLSTTRYALNIAFAQEEGRICRKYGLDYQKVVTEFEKIFNRGTLEINQSQLIRPLVFPGFIEGHCLMPNIKILKSFYKSDFFDLIEKSNEKRKMEGK